MEKPPTLKGPLAPIPIADDTVWVTKDGAWVIVSRRSWDRRAAPGASPPQPSAVPARKRPPTEEDMGLVLGTGGAMPPPPVRGAASRARATEPVLIEGRDPARLGLIVAAGILGVVLVLAIGVAVGIGWHRSRQLPASPVPVLQPVELANPAPPETRPGFRTPSEVVGAPGEDTGGSVRSPAGSTVVLGRASDDESAKPDAPRFVIPPMPEEPPGQKPHWVRRLSTGWRALDGDPERASKQFRRVTASRPRLPDGHLGLGVALIRLGQPAQAVVPLCTAAGLSPAFEALAKGPLDAIGRNCP